MLKPHLARLQQLVNSAEEMPVPLFVATIDAERWTVLATAHGVTKYPSILYFVASRRSSPAFFPGTDMASLLQFVGVQAQLGWAARTGGHGSGGDGRAEPSASAFASPEGGAAQWPDGPMGAIECSGAPPGLLVGGELGGLEPSPKPAAQGGPRSLDEVSPAAVARWDPSRKAWAALGALGGSVHHLHVRGACVFASGSLRVDGRVPAGIHAVGHQADARAAAEAIAAWSGGAWQRLHAPLGTPLGAPLGAPRRGDVRGAAHQLGGGVVHAMAVLGRTLFVGGSFDLRPRDRTAAGGAAGGAARRQGGGAGGAAAGGGEEGGESPGEGRDLDGRSRRDLEAGDSELEAGASDLEAGDTKLEEPRFVAAFDLDAPSWRALGNGLDG